MVKCNWKAEHTYKNQKLPFFKHLRRTETVRKSASTREFLHLTDKIVIRDIPYSGSATTAQHCNIKRNFALRETT